MSATRVDCTPERHAGAMLAIFNEAIEHSTALWDYRPRPPEAMVAWFDAKRAAGHPVIGFESAAGELLAFGSWGPFRAWPAYKYSVEHSVYVHRDHRGRGLGRLLLQTLLGEAQRRGVHVMVGGIEAGNRASIALHAALGFVHAGTVREVGFKFGRWLDLVLMQRVLHTPEEPRDDA
jgi:L-amino acid N-acyltransferase